MGVLGFWGYCWASSPRNSLGIVEVLADRIRWLLQVALISVLEIGRLLLEEVAERQSRVLLLLSYHLVQCKVLSLLGHNLLPLAAAHLLGHLDPPRLGVVDLGGHEGLCLRLLGGSDRKYTGGSQLGWLLRR